MYLSVVIPVYNEEESIPKLFESIAKALTGAVYEIICVDDGSKDKTVEVINAHAVGNPNVKVIQFSRNYGQTSAMAAGINVATGEFIATLDGDLQNDPSDIPMMLEKLEKENLDIVTGKRAKRQDNVYIRKIPSKIANWVIRRSTGVDIQDYGCTLKVFRANVAKQLDLYGELHRFIPVLGALEGARIAQVDVKHHARQFGVSKYGIGRTFRVLSDLILMLFFLKYRQKPMHLFGGLGVGMLGIGGCIETYLLFYKIIGHEIGGRPLFYIGILLIIMGVQFITTGFLAELLMRTYYESQGKKTYNIRQCFAGGKKLAEARFPSQHKE